jgi:hypothetical protein
VNIHDFTTPRPVAKFEDVGDFVAGTLVEDPVVEEDRYGDGQVLLLVVRSDDDGIEYRIYARKRKQLGVAIGEAVINGGGQIQAGDWLRVEHTGLKQTGGAYPTKLFDAEFRKAAPIGTAELGEADEADEVLF